MAKHRKASKAAKSMAALGVITAVPATALTVAPPQAMAQDLPPDAIVQCESGGDHTAQNPSSTASGKYQMINGTWLAYGGGKYAPEAHLATEAEQDRVAAKLWAAEGSSPWNASKHCWGGKDMTPERAATPVKQEAPKPQPKKAEVKAEVKTKKVETKKVEKVAVSSVPTNAKHTHGGDGLYTVKLGDTLSSLAKDNGTTVDRLMELNKDIIEMPDWIFVGERIHLS